jgi:GNAT superfamily N-acetyltransferase
MTIRPFAPQRDEPALRECTLALQDFERTLEADLPPGEAMADAYLAHLFRCCAQWQGRMFVAEADDRVVGFVCVYGRCPQEELDENPAPYAFVSDLVVLTPYRNAGIGQQLLAAAESHARAWGVSVVNIGGGWGNDGERRQYKQGGVKPNRTEQ